AMADLALKGKIQLKEDYHLALTLDAKARKGLLDGELQGQQASPGSSTPAPHQTASRGRGPPETP
ncbi:hypothetical protein, partial [Aeromonas dhakensis]|uniref:hypothetical protein n=1 Tax=Aeromonas dhakensis TaxID=196024 RepID=UPI001FCC8A85